MAIVNQAFIDRYLGGGEAVGQRITLGSPDRRRPWTTIVGVAADYRNAGATRAVRPESGRGAPPPSVSSDYC